MQSQCALALQYAYETLKQSSSALDLSLKKFPKKITAMLTLSQGQSTFVFNLIPNTVTHPPMMSYFAPSTSSLQSTERIGQCAVDSERQERYAYRPMGSHGSR